MSFTNRSGLVPALAAICESCASCSGVKWTSIDFRIRETLARCKLHDGPFMRISIVRSKDKRVLVFDTVNDDIFPPRLDCGVRDRNLHRGNVRYRETGSTKKRSVM